MKKVYGSYLNISDARKAINELLLKGYTRDDMKVVSNKELDGDLNYRKTNVESDDESLWDKVKDLFTSDENEENDDVYLEKDLSKNERNELTGYKSNLQAGEIIILLNERLEQHDKTLNKDVDNDERVMELKKERLNVDKEEVQTGEVDIKKVVKEETQTIEVPVEKEEIVIEKRSAGGREVKDGETIGTDSFKDGKEIHIPIKEERVHVSKDTVVDDEVVISKDKHKESKTITEQVKHEDVEVEGDAKFTDDLKGKNRKDKI